MDITMMSKCHRCTKEFEMGVETHNYKFKNGKPMVGGKCPWCGAYVTNVMHPTKIKTYPQVGITLRADGTEIPITYLPYGGEQHA